MSKVTHEGFGAECSEGNDLGNAFIAIFFTDRANDILAAGRAEVDVKIGG